MGVRGLCNGLGPAAFGLMFHLFGINIVDPVDTTRTHENIVLTNSIWEVGYFCLIMTITVVKTFEDSKLWQHGGNQVLHNTFTFNNIGYSRTTCARPEQERRLHHTENIIMILLLLSVSVYINNQF